jgi:hypothetical protein
MKVGIVGSHGLYATYGGWDQLVNNLAESADPECEFVIFNPKETLVNKHVIPKDVRVISLPLSASGFSGLLFDCLSILLASLYCQRILLLGLKGMPAAVFVKLLSFSSVQIFANIGGIEWERPQFSWLQQRYLKFCFYLANTFCNKVILDNKHYMTYYEELADYQDKLAIIPYGGAIDSSLSVEDDFMNNKYCFLKLKFFLSISEDNKLEELCRYFEEKQGENLVLISNFSNSKYGRDVLHRFSSISNIHLIDGLYDKTELDCIRRACHAYIHTHTLCGSAPSLIEMIVAGRPILSIDVPQNRYTLKGFGFMFGEFSNLDDLVHKADLSKYSCPPTVASSYEWPHVVRRYRTCFLEV